MEYKVISASKYNPFEVCIVEFTGYFEVRDEDVSATGHDDIEFLIQA